MDGAQDVDIASTFPAVASMLVQAESREGEVLQAGREHVVMNLVMETLSFAAESKLELEPYCCARRRASKVAALPGSWPHPLSFALSACGKLGSAEEEVTTHAGWMPAIYQQVRSKA